MKRNINIIINIAYHITGNDMAKKKPKMTPIPCKKCIALAICKNKRTVHCKELYSYLVKYDDSGFIGYRHGHSNKLNKLFGRQYIVSTQHDTWRIEFTEREFENG